VPPGDDTSQEKSLEPTPKKISEAKEKGQFARSQEVSTVATLLVMLVFLWLGRDFVLNRLLHVSGFYFRFDRLMDLSARNLGGFLWRAVVQLLPVIMPMFGLVFVAGLTSELAQIGIRVVKDPFEPKWDKLNPVAGVKRMLSLRQLMEAPKSLIKLGIVGGMAYVTLRRDLPVISLLPTNTPGQGVLVLAHITLKLAFRICLIMMVFAAADYWFQRWQYFSKLRMSHEEMKQEVKEQEGDPVLKARMRSIQMDIARKRMMAAVPDSDVVIVNPTHYAVALRYDPEKSQAPIMVAKGQNFIAQRIREVALDGQVPVVENPPLARAIYKQVQIGQGIPGALFKAVATILASIWKISKRRGRVWARRN